MLNRDYPSGTLTLWDDRRQASHRYTELNHSKIYPNPSIEYRRHWHCSYPLCFERLQQRYSAIGRKLCIFCGVQLSVWSVGASIPSRLESQLHCLASSNGVKSGVNFSRLSKSCFKSSTTTANLARSWTAYRPLTMTPRCLCLLAIRARNFS